MRKIFKKLLLSCLMLAFSFTASAQNESYDWTKVMDAIIKVESKGNPKAHNPNGNCAGILQITKILVREANQILKKNKSQKHYTYADRYNAEKSKEMFILLQEHFNPEHNVEKAIKCWNCGFYHKTKNEWKNKSIDYWKKVMSHYNNGGE